VDHRLTLSDLSDTLERLPGSRLAQMTPPPDPASISPLVLNCVAAMVEAAAHDREVDPPSWVRDIPALPRPHFGWVLRSLRPHQVRASPVAFKRRNVFFDPATGPLP